MPKTTRRNYPTPAEAFAARTERRGDCLIWTGAVKESGYGAMWDGTRVTAPHRWAWEQANGPRAKGTDLDHTCHNRLCANVNHLRVTTRKQNMENLTGPRTGNTSGVRGVSVCPKTGKWRVRVKHNYQEFHGGTYVNLEDAERAAIALRNRLFTHNDADRLEERRAA